MVDQMLGGLFGGPDGDRMRSQARDFVERYNSGPPQEGYSDDEVMERFRQVSGHINDDDMRDAARESFRRMSPEQRREFKRAMRRRGARHFDRDDSDDPDVLAQQTQSFMKEQPQQGEGGLGGLLGGLFGGGQSSQPQVERRDEDGGSLLENPAVKAAMAGMAAFAMKKMMDNR